MSEKTWQGMVERVAVLNGWRRYHTFDSRRSVAGFPDLLMIRGDRIIAAELKAEDGAVTVAQQEWLDAFAGTGKVEVYVWRPGEWETVTKVLGDDGEWRASRVRQGGQRSIRWRGTVRGS